MGWACCARPRAPGAQLGAIPLAWLVHWAGGFWLLAVATLALFGLGLWASNVYLAGRAEDPSEIVIDEVVGQMIALWPLSFMLTHPRYGGPYLSLAGLDRRLCACSGCSIFSSRRRSIGLDRPGALGVMLDDVLAGILAGAVVLLAAGVAHGWI